MIKCRLGQFSHCGSSISIIMSAIPHDRSSYINIYSKEFQKTGTLFSTGALKAKSQYPVHLLATDFWSSLRIRLAEVPRNLESLRVINQLLIFGQGKLFVSVLTSGIVAYGNLAFEHTTFNSPFWIAVSKSFPRDLKTLNILKEKNNDKKD